MSQTLRERRQQTSGDRTAGRPVPEDALTGDRRRHRRGYPPPLLLTVYGTALGVILVTLGFTTLATSGTGLKPAAELPLQAAGAGQQHNHGSHSHAGGAKSGATTPRVRVRAQHIGNLVVDVSAHITLNQPPRALTNAKAIAYLDMVQMPGAHKQGPVTLQASQTPGYYEAQVDVPMPGDYNVRVILRDPARVVARTRVRVATTS